MLLSNLAVLNMCHQNWPHFVWTKCCQDIPHISIFKKKWKYENLTGVRHTKCYNMFFSSWVHLRKYFFTLRCYPTGKIVDICHFLKSAYEYTDMSNLRLLQCKHSEKLWSSPIIVNQCNVKINTLKEVQEIQTLSEEIRKFWSAFYNSSFQTTHMAIALPLNTRKIWRSLGSP